MSSFLFFYSHRFFFSGLRYWFCKPSSEYEKKSLARWTRRHFPSDRIDTVFRLSDCVSFLNDEDISTLRDYANGASRHLLGSSLWWVERERDWLSSPVESRQPFGAFFPTSRKVCGYWFTFFSFSFLLFVSFFFFKILLLSAVGNKSEREQQHFERMRPLGPPVV